MLIGISASLTITQYVYNPPEARLVKGHPGLQACVYRTKDRAIFLYGFAKSERENIEAAELEDLRLIAADFLAVNDEGFERIIAQEDLQEITP